MGNRYWMNIFKNINEKIFDKEKNFPSLKKG